MISQITEEHIESLQASSGTNKGEEPKLARVFRKRIVFNLSLDTDEAAAVDSILCGNKGSQASGCAARIIC